LDPGHQSFTAGTVSSTLGRSAADLADEVRKLPLTREDDALAAIE